MYATSDLAEGVLVLHGEAIGGNDATLDPNGAADGLEDAADDLNDSAHDLNGSANGLSDAVCDLNDAVFDLSDAVFDLNDAATTNAYAYPDPDVHSRSRNAKGAVD